MSTTGPEPAHGHSVVCGVDHLGLRTVEELRLRDEEVVAIGPTADTEEWLAEHGVRLIVGDHRLTKTLRAADIKHARVIVLTGDDDLGNLNTALAAAEINPGIRVVIRLFDQELGAHIPQLFDDAVALSSSALAAPGFVSAAIDGESGSRFRLGGRLHLEPPFEHAVERRDGHPHRPPRRRPHRRAAARRGRERARPDPDRRRRPGGLAGRSSTRWPRRPPGARSGGALGGPRPHGGAGAAPREVRRDPARPRDRLGGLLPARSRPRAAGRDLVRDHAADRRVAPDERGLREQRRPAAGLRHLPEPHRRGASSRSSTRSSPTR